MGGRIGYRPMSVYLTGWFSAQKGYGAVGTLLEDAKAQIEEWIEELNIEP